MTIRLSVAQVKRLGVRAKGPTKPSARERYGGYASSWEQDYADYLASELQMGRIRRWQYESLRFLLAHKTTYVPDFLVEPVRGPLQMHEVKGYFRDKDRIKVKVTARLFPMFTFVVVRKVNGLWEYEEMQR